MIQSSRPSPNRVFFSDIARCVKAHVEYDPRIPQRLRLMGTIVALLSTATSEVKQDGNNEVCIMVLDDGTDLVHVQLTSFMIQQLETKSTRITRSSSDLFGKDWMNVPQMHSSVDNSGGTVAVSSPASIGTTVDCIVRVEKTSFNIGQEEEHMSFGCNEKNIDLSTSSWHHNPIQLHAEQIGIITDPCAETLRWMELSYQYQEENNRTVLRELQGAPSLNQQPRILRIDRRKVDNEYDKRHLQKLLSHTDAMNDEFKLALGYPMQQYSKSDVFRMILSTYDGGGRRNHRNSLIPYTGLSSEDISFCLDLDIPTIDQYLTELVTDQKIYQTVAGKFVPR